MKYKLRKILFVFALVFGFIANVNAETSILEDTSIYTGDVYIIGSSKFDNNVIVTGTMASVAGAREAYIQYLLYENEDFNPEDIKIYYFSELDKTWSILPRTEEDNIQELTEEEVKDLTKELKIYYVNEEEKILEVPYEVSLKEGYELEFYTNEPSKDSEVKYKDGKIFVPATIKRLEVFAVNNETSQKVELDEFEQIDTNYETNSLVVKTLKDLKEAIASEQKEIRLEADITGITETIVIPYTVTLKGAGYKLAFKNIERVNGVASGLVIQGEESYVTDLTVEMDGIAGWQGNYALQVYNANNVELNNFTGTKADAALLVNGANVILTGDVNVSGNEFGGIEVSKGTAEGLNNSLLSVNGSIIMNDELISKPAIWVESEQGDIWFDEIITYYESNNIPTAFGKETQTYYYLNEKSFKEVDVSTKEELLLANSLKEVEVITLAADIDLETATEVSKEVVVDLNGHNLTVKEDVAGDGVFHVIAGGKLTINGEGTIDGVGNNNWNIAIWADGGEVIINGGTYTNAGAGEDDHYDLIYAKNGGKVTINGGIFEAHTPKWTLNLKDSDGSKIVVKGGTFKNYNPGEVYTEPTQPLNFVANGYKVVEENGEFTVVELDGTENILVNRTEYDNLQTAIDNANNGVTINILKDIDLTTAVIVDKKIVLELNGHNLTVKEDVAGDGVFHVIAGGKLTINGEGTIDGVGNNNWNIAIWADGGEVIINGGTYTNAGAGEDDHYDLIYAKNGGKVTINGGNFEAHTPKWTLNLKDSDGSEIIVKGGTFKNYNPGEVYTEPTQPLNFLADGYKVIEVTDGYTVVPYDAENVTDEQELRTLMAQDGIVKLGADIDLTTAVEVTGEVELDLKGYSLTIKEDTVGDGVFHVLTGGKLTINGEGTIDGVGKNDWQIAIWADGGEVIINGGTYTNVGAGVDDHYDLIYAKNGGKVTINGGNFEAHTPKWTLNLKDSDGSEIIVKGGTFKNYNPGEVYTEPTQPLNFLADGYKVVEDETNNLFTVVVVEEEMA